MRKIALALLSILFLSQSGAANAHDHRHDLSRHRHQHISHNSGGRPSAWCGWYMRQQVGQDPGPSYNLARNWTHWGTAASGPAVGRVVVWAHHVGKITGYDNVRHEWIVLSGNDGHAVRDRPRNLAGAIGFRSP